MTLYDPLIKCAVHLVKTYTQFVFLQSFCKSITLINNYPPNIYLFKVNNRNSSKRSEICSKLTMKTPERHH